MSRDIKLSNLKGLLIFLVVFGHIIAPYQEHYRLLYLFIYSFHMPLFIMVTGYFAKRVSFKKVINFFLLFAIFQPLYRGFLVLINPGKVFNLRAEVPYYHLWFLLATMLWYLMAVGIRKIPLKNIHKAATVLVFLMIGIGVKFFAEPFQAFMHNYDSKFISDSFSYMRTLSFLPFFFIGFFLPQEGMNKLYHSLRGNKLIPVLAIIGLFAYLKLEGTDFEEMIFKGNSGIGELGGSMQLRIVHILIAYLIALVMCYVLLNLITEKKCFLTKIGDRTLPVFLFHAFFIMLSKKTDLSLIINPWLLLPLLFLTSVIIIALLSSDIFMKCTYFLWNPMELISKAAGAIAKRRQQPDI